MFRSRSAFRYSYFLLALAGFFLFHPPSAVRASIFGTVRGIVHDVQHHPIQGARVELRAKQSDWQRSATTDADGGFQIDAVPAGEYTLHISRQSFRDLDQAILVAADTAPLRHFPLDLASVAQRVEVQADADRIDPSSSGSTSTVTHAEIQELPGASR